MDSKQLRLQVHVFAGYRIPFYLHIKNADGKRVNMHHFKVWLYLGYGKSQKYNGILTGKIMLTTKAGWMLLDLITVHL